MTPDEYQNRIKMKKKRKNHKWKLEPDINGETCIICGISRTRNRNGELEYFDLKTDPYFTRSYTTIRPNCIDQL